MQKSDLLILICLLTALLLVGCGDHSGPSGESGSPNVIVAPGYTEVPDTDRPKESDTEDTKDIEDTDSPDVTLPGQEDTAEPSVTTDPPKAEESTVPAADPIPPHDGEGRTILDLRGTLSDKTPARGKFISTESTKLQLAVNYTCRIEEDGTVAVDMEVGLETYDIQCGGRSEMGKITVNGITHTYSTDPISNTEGKRIFVPFEYYTYHAKAGDTSCDIHVSWAFNGTYGGEVIETLNAGARLIWGD